MRMEQILEREEKIAYDRLYHMCSAGSLSYAVTNDTLSGRTQGYVSTTWDPAMDRVVNIWHTDFKLILDGRKLAKDYKLFRHKFDFVYSGGGADHGKSAKHDPQFDEREIGVRSKEISPLRDYLIGVVLLFDPASRTAIQSLFYRHSSYASIVSGSHHPDLPLAGQAMETLMHSWRIPIYVRTSLGKVRSMTGTERRFLDRAFQLAQAGATFDDAMLRLATEFHVRDHDGDRLTRSRVIRIQKGPDLDRMINDAFQGRTRDSMTDEDRRRLFHDMASHLGYDRKIVNSITGKLERLGLFHASADPSDWSVIFGYLIKGNFNKLRLWITDHNFHANLSRKREIHDMDPSSGRYVYYGTGITG